jgi:nickel/cobalt exporter
MNFQALLAQGAGNAWLFVPTAIFLGALHGLEPGHSKTMMAAFIVAIRGTAAQAVLLGVAATVSHTAIVWGIALGGMYFFKDLSAESSEPWFQLLSGAIIIAIALWMFRRSWLDRQDVRKANEAVAAYGREAAANALSQRVDTGHGQLAIEIVGDGAAARFRIKVLSGDPWEGDYLTLTTERADGTKEKFRFLDREGYMESAETVAMPHAFKARLDLDHGDHEHSVDLAFGVPVEKTGLDLGDDQPVDAHARLHAKEIRKKFDGRKVTNWQILLFGLTGGLIPCPAAVTVLLLCLQLKEFTLGVILVLCFSIGLALTLVAVGTVAAVGVGRIKNKTSFFSTVADRAPYFSSGLIALVGLYVMWHGWSGLMSQGH